MGRLSLNVLLSFAQFEREVTAERIRDKFAASKRKGLWMGGRVPLGYDLKERQLRVNPAEAKLVRSLYERYLALGCVSKLHAELNAHGLVSKQRISRRGLASGGVPYSRGALYELLKNRLYLGEITYRGEIHCGQHEAIVERSVWERVQQHLARGRTARREGTRARVPSLLLGRVYSDSGARYTPTHSSKRDKRYRYYVLQSAGPQRAISAPLGRISALNLESLVLQRLLAWLNDPLALLDALSNPGDDTALAQTLLAAASARCRAWPTLSSEQLREFVRAAVVKVTIGPANIAIAMSKCAWRALLLAVIDNTVYESEDDLIELSVEACQQRRGRATRLVISRDTPGCADSQDHRRLVQTLAQAHQWLAQLRSGEVSLRRMGAAVGKSERYVSKVICAAFLAPDLVEALLGGYAPPTLTLAELTKELPWDWDQQRRRFAAVLGAKRTALHPESVPCNP
jgi:hypothetical protein